MLAFWEGSRHMPVILLPIFTLKENIHQALIKYSYRKFYSIIGYYNKLTTDFQSHYQTDFCFLLTRVSCKGLY